ncbi:hypothetical protein F0L74_09910 [Chitinophaga agrisoli]|uniref:Uncharacterized protein n=1 Tax=Chitinophaga agrisoli TaxID=2607653 RepID=A0A5B2VVS9_9BACT|nr:hypothetical protein [Chitinophaga agrisoli]KAA2242834.1 hypothetical protein F0L74_09910 [Chitinophaga agrisoli]
MENIETKHSPGPWTLDADWNTLMEVPGAGNISAFNSFSSWIRDANRCILADVKAYEAEGFVKPSSGQYEANARLLCAAPLLLSALMEAVKHADEAIAEDLADYNTCKPADTLLEAPASWYPSWYAGAKDAILSATNTQP